MKPDTYSVTIVWSDEDQAFVTEVSELPGCMAHGESSEQAIEQIEFAIENWIDTARQTGREIPAPHHFADYEALRDQKVAEQIRALQTEVAKQIEAIFEAHGKTITVSLPKRQSTKEVDSPKPQPISK